MPRASRGPVWLTMLCLALAGCGTYEWQRSDGAAGRFDADAAGCQQPVPPEGFVACMNRRGWTLVTH